MGAESRLITAVHIEIYKMLGCKGLEFQKGLWIVRGNTGVFQAYPCAYQGKRFL